MKDGSVNSLKNTVIAVDFGLWVKIVGQCFYAVWKQIQISLKIVFIYSIPSSKFGIKKVFVGFFLALVTFGEKEKIYSN